MSIFWARFGLHSTKNFWPYSAIIFLACFGKSSLKTFSVYIFRLILDTTDDNYLSSGKPVHLEQLISGHVQVQNDLCSQTRANIDSVAERRAEERSQITATYAETVSKLIHIIGDLERITSEHMYSEQSWVEQLLKRVRNEADSATNEFHAYLGTYYRV